MSLMIIVTLLAMITVEAEASNDELLAKKFSPILILTEDIRREYGEIPVIKPEPIDIMSAPQSADSIRFELYNKLGQQVGGIFDWRSLANWNPSPVSSSVNFLQDSFAFLGFLSDEYTGKPLLEGTAYAYGQYTLIPYFDYPGKGTKGWNDAYSGESGKGPHAGENKNFPNTAYVHIYKRTIEQYKATYDSVTVIQYKYFYPYNDWWNNHEGDWQGIDVVVSSRSPATAEFLGVEYRFHGAWLSYYKDYGDKPGITDSFVFNAVGDVRLAAHTHPVAYIGAGSHASYPIGGDIKLFSFLETLPSSGGAEAEGGVSGAAITGDWEHMTHTGLVLSTLADGAHNDLWESYNLVLLPDPDPTNTNNMGLTSDMSWLGAQVHWGTPFVASPPSSGNKSPKGPYNSRHDPSSKSRGWGELNFFKVGSIVGDPFHHSDLYAPGSSPLSVTEYHHWAVIGADSLSGTVSLRGDVVVFPGATLTIKAGTTITFPSKRDRHQFKKGDDSLSEIFVYGTLKSAGTSSHPVVFRGPDPADNAHDWGGIQKMTGGTIALGDHTTLRNALPPPTIEGLANVSFAENDPETIATYAVANPAPYTITWSVSGTDVSSFQIDGVGVLSFADPPNHEQQALYSVDVVATDGSLADTLTVQVTVTDVNDPGTVTLSTARPQVGAEITATLRDEDGLVGDVAWSQHYVRPDQVGGAVGEPFETTSPHLRLSPTLGGYDFYVRAVYTDGFGSQSAESVPTLLVGPPAAPASLTAVPGDGQVVLEWEAPLSDGGQPITGYEYRQSKDGGTTWKPDWTVIADSDEETTGHTVDGLTNDTQYTFEVRAVNNIGKGAVLQATATPVSSNRPPVLTGFAEASVSEGLIRVTTYRASDPDKDSLVWSLGGTDAAAFELFGRGQARTLRLKTPPDFEQQATYSLTIGVSDGSRSATLDVTVRVINIEEAGRVALTSTQPQVGTPLTATLSDPDGSITGAVWQWQRRASSTADWVEVSVGVTGTSGMAELSSYTPQAGDVGYMLQATVRYRDGHSNATKTVQSAATEAVVGPPAVVASLTAVPGNGQVALGWQAPALDGGSPITGYEYRQSEDGGTTWQPDWTAIADSDAQTTGHTVEDLTNDTAYTFAVRAVNAVGAGAARRVTATPVWSNQPPTLTGPEEATVAEHSTDAMGPYEADDPDDDALTWSLSGADADAFAWAGTGLTRSLALKTPPDFEQQASYTVTVAVSDAEPLSATVTTTVSVSNVDEAGTVALTSTQPQVGTPLTATLSDPDGSITGAAWQWQRRASSTADWADVPAGAEGASGVAELSSYTPQAGDVGLMLQATVRYRDGHSTDATDTKTARSATTEGVVGPPAAVASLTAAPGDGQVALTWQAPAADGGVPITGYEYRQSADGGTTWQPDWTAIADSDDETTGHTVSGLTNGTTYTFEVRAVNAVGKGAARAVTATPVPSNQPPTLKGPATATVAEHSTDAIGPYEADDPDNDDLTWSLGGADAAAFELTGTGNTRSLAFKTPPDFEQQSSYAVSVSVDDGALSATVTTTVSVANIDEAGTVTLSSTAPQVGVPLTATLSDADGGITNLRWSWLYFRAGVIGQGEEVPAALGTADGQTGTLTPTRVLVETRIQARALYDDGHGTGKSAESVQTDPVVAAPSKVGILLATAGDRQVTLAWSAAIDFGAAIGRYEYRYSDGQTWTAWKEVAGGAEAREQTVSGLTNGTQYTFEVRAVNRVGAGEAFSVTATPQPANQSPTLKGPDTATVAEHSTGPIGPYEASDPDNDPLTWTLGGADAAAFEWDSTGLTRSLALKTPPDFEQQSSYTVTVAVADAEPLSATVTTTVSVSNIDEAGTVALTSTQPQVGTPLTATLSDPDGSITGAVWQWQRRASSAADWTAVPAGAEGASGGAELSSYTPQAGDVGLRVQATVHYRDGHSSSATKTARSAATEGVVGPPEAVASLTAVPGDGQVALTWQAPASDGGASISGYEYRQSKDGGTTWQPDWTAIANSDAQTTSHTVSGLTNGTTYTFAVRAVNRVGKGAARAAPATPVPSNRSPSLTGPATATVAEQSTGTIGSYEASDPDNDPLTWTLSGADASAFEWTSTGTTRSLAFKRTPDFEQQARYAVSVSVDDGALSATVATTVSVSNVDEAGTVSLSSTAPRVGTAIRATLSDPDGGVTNLRWRWSYFRPAGAVGASEDEAGEEEAVEGASSGLSTTFTPRARHVGLRLRARALYDDGHGSNKQAYSVKTDPVIGPPGKPSLSAAAGTGQITLTWTAADAHGSAIQRYEYRRSGGSWATVSGGAAARRQTITGLSNCTAYTFEVRAVNGEGDGPADSASATLSGSTPPRPGLSASAGDKQVTLTWTAPTVDSCVPIGRYESRRSGGNWATVSGGASARSQTITGLTNGTAYTFEVRAVNAAGDGSAARISATPVQPNVDDPGTVSLSSSQPRVGTALTATLSDPDGSVKNLRWRWSYFRATGVAGASEEAAGEEEAVEGASSGLATTFTPRTIHIGLRLRARALYDDGHGSNKQAQSAKTDAVIDRPGPPGTLSGRPGSIYTRVDLRWTAAKANGAPITDYQYRYRRNGTSSWSSWTSMGVVTSYTVSGLQSGASYAFQVRAVNKVGAGPSADTTGTVRAQADEDQDQATQDEEAPAEDEPDEEAPDEDAQAEDEEDEAQDEEAPAENVQDEAAAAKRTVLPDAALVVHVAPNPFNPTTSLQLHLPVDSPVWLTIYNITGQVVRTIVAQSLEAGYHTFRWDGYDQQGYPVTSGVYLYRVQTTKQGLVGKMALIR